MKHLIVSLLLTTTLSAPAVQPPAGGAPVRHILMVVANPAVATTTGWPVGFWAAELTHPYWIFTRHGYQVTIASPAGGRVELDAYSDPRADNGYSAHDALSLGYLHMTNFTALLQNTPALDTVKVEDYDAIVVAGGQSPMFTFVDNEKLHQLFAAFYEAGKVSAALCHGTCILLKTKGSNGELLAAGKRITGFANSEEDYADQAVGQKVMPFRIEDEARTLGLNFVTGPAFQPHAIRDGLLITGQQQNSGEEVARLVIESLENEP
jgi:putative intracellular protease/amidase